LNRVQSDRRAFTLLDVESVGPRGPPTESQVAFSFSAAPEEDELVRVSQLFVVNDRLPFPIEGRYALHSQPTFGNRVIDGIYSETTWVIPKAEQEVTWLTMLMTGRPTRTGLVEFKVRRSELQLPRGLKRPFAKYQMIVDGKIDLSETWREPKFSRAPRLGETLWKWVGEVLATAAKSNTEAELLDSLASTGAAQNAPFDERSLVAVHAYFVEGTSTSERLELIEFVTCHESGGIESHLVRIRTNSRGRKANKPINDMDSTGFDSLDGRYVRRWFPYNDLAESLAFEGLSAALESVQSDDQAFDNRSVDPYRRHADVPQIAE
jgi:hypothetical protein